MKRFKNILYHADGKAPSNPSLDQALALAESNQARLTVMDVIPESELAGEVEQRLGLEINEVLRQSRLDQLDAMLKPHIESGIPIYTQVVSGTPFIELIRAVQRNGFDLLIKAPHPQESLTERLFYDSFDLHLLRKCPCPVWIDQPSSQHPYRHILAAVDPTQDGSIELNRLIMDLASSLAKREDAELHVLHAWRLQGESMLRSGLGRVSTEKLEQLLADTEQRHRKQLNDLLEDYQLSAEDPQVKLLKEWPAKAIESYSETINADLIVMGTLGRSGIPGLIIGNTAENILRLTRASIMAVKPKGFVSPVTP